MIEGIQLEGGVENPLRKFSAFSNAYIVIYGMPMIPCQTY